MEERHKRIREELEKLVKKKNIKMKNRIAKLSEDLDDVDYITQGIGEKKEKMIRTPLPTIEQKKRKNA